MERSEQVGELIAALAKAQAEFGSAIKESDNPAYRSKYADLASNIGAVRPALNKHGIALIQFNDADLERQTASVTTAIYHGEQFISVTAEAPAVGRNGFDVQSIGSCWTYLRRYTLQGICGLASEDDDGNSLTKENADGYKQSYAPKEVRQKEYATKVEAIKQEIKPLVNRQLEASLKAEGVFSVTGDRITCCPVDVLWPKDKNGKPYANVIFNGTTPDGHTQASCWDTKFHDLLKSCRGKEVAFIGKINGKFMNIADVVSVDGHEYREGIAVNAESTEPLITSADVPF